ncbi:cutA [Wigglesworthia glossinidia endosymbiont of Glossina brevipalpis]|uniref:CutA protein n=1 Tax=Wigglesworthia glossinidia brevipalpis TaxID=36870 RepID=Q8D2F8_WIGBR|nr:cutA [Wigglesworthia glossinidia endosymbiont of Glossina brevipalpis]
MKNLSNITKNNFLNEKYFCVILCTIPDNDSANYIIKQILKKKLAACVTKIPEVISFYYWNKILEEKKEVQILIKSHIKLRKKVFSLIKNIHPYKIPEIISISTNKIEKYYKNWIVNNISILKN